MWWKVTGEIKDMIEEQTGHFYSEIKNERQYWMLIDVGRDSSGE